MNDLLCDIRMFAQVSFILSQCTCVWQRDRWTQRPWQYCMLHYMQLHGKNQLLKTLVFG